jgi:hypothetical protein
LRRRGEAHGWWASVPAKIVIGGTEDELGSAGAALTELPSGYEGDYVLLASALADPLAGES